MKDKYGRDITYLRISITDECNLRCLYCMPEEAGSAAKSCSLMSVDEIEKSSARRQNWVFIKYALQEGNLWCGPT